MNDISISNKEISDRLKALDPAKHQEKYFLDDKSMGLLFSEMFPFARFNTTTNLWTVFDGIKWITDAGNLIVEGFAQRLATALYIYATNLDDHYRKFYLRYGSYGPRKTMLLEARNFRSVSMEDFDTNKYLFNVRNGTLDLKKFEFREHRADDLLSCVANVDYDPEAKCPLFDRFFSEITESPGENGELVADPDKADYVQRIVGYSMIGDVREDEFYLFYGATTRNGKSTLLETLGDIFGDYAEMIEPDTLSQSRKVAQNDEQIADLKGKRLAHVEEPSRQMVFDTGLIKKMTGRTKLTASRKYEHRFKYKPEFTIIFATNYLPTVLDDTLFKSGRCKVILFERSFSKEEQDPDMRKKLFEEASGILNWALRGLGKYYKRRTAPPATVLAATDEYQQNSDRIANFMRECTVEDEGPDAIITLKRLYARYTDWCSESGYSAEGRNKFSDALKRKRLLVDRKKINGVDFHNVILKHKIIEDTSQFVPVTESEIPETFKN